MGSEDSECLLWEVHLLEQNDGESREHWYSWLTRTLSWLEAEYIGEHVWHCGVTPSQSLCAMDEDTSVPSLLLRGSIPVSECSTDEWLMLWLLQQMSSFADRSLAFRGYNSHDGEIILIEAADHLPPWVADPPHAWNRSWLISGELVVLPPFATPRFSRNLPVDKAMRALQGYACDIRHIRAPEAVRNVFHQALDNMRHTAVDQNAHIAPCLLPLQLALVLKSNNQFIAHAVHALKMREPRGLRNAASCWRFPPSDGTTFVNIRFSKLLFAQLEAQSYRPPKEWPHQNARNARVRDAALRGAKVAAGSEMTENEVFKQTIAEMSEHSSDGIGCDTPPEGDDDSWLNEGEALLQAEEAEQQATDSNSGDLNGLDHVVTGVKEFMEGVSGHEGAEDYIDGGAAFDTDTFVKELSNVLSLQTNVTKEERRMSSEYNPHSDSADRHGDSCKCTDGEYEKGSTSSTSDDLDDHHEDDDFMEQYEDVLSREVNSMTATQPEQQLQAEQPRETEPVCVDQQLVENIVRSYTAQLGRPGPASNVVGALGYALPEETSE